jgi:hypothetical protein
MSKIIDIEGRLKEGQQKRLKIDKAKKAEAVRKVLQCTRCLARCLKCGVQFDTQGMYKRYKGPFRLCESCQEEYEQFLRVRDAGETSPCYWHNRQWRRVWQTWLDYQQAMKEYGDSSEFLDLVREVEWDR